MLRTNYFIIYREAYHKCLFFFKISKKTLSIPEWMNESAMALGLNFSQVLQEALLQKIQNS